MQSLPWCNSLERSLCCQASLTAHTCIASFCLLCRRSIHSSTRKRSDIRLSSAVLHRDFLSVGIACFGSSELSAIMGGGGGTLGKKVAGCHLVEPSVSGPDDLDGSVWPLAVNIQGSQASSWDTGPKRWGGVVGDCEVTLRLPHGVRVQRTLASPHGHCPFKHCPPPAPQTPPQPPSWSPHVHVHKALIATKVSLHPFLRNPASVAPCSL